MPPSIVNEGTVEDVKVKERQSIILACEVTGKWHKPQDYFAYLDFVLISFLLLTVFWGGLGNPVPEITWLKDGHPLTSDSRLQVMSNGRFLQISGSQVADTGRYSCLASNSAGDRSRHFNLNVLGMFGQDVLQCLLVVLCVDLFMFLSPVSPTIAGSGPEGSAEEVTVTLNSPTSLVCEAQSYPPAIITWLKDGTTFESSRNVRVLPGQMSTLILDFGIK